MTGTEQDGRCWRCPAKFSVEAAEPVTDRGRPLDASGREMRRIRCPRCGAVNSAEAASDRARGVDQDTVNRFSMP